MIPVQTTQGLVFTKLRFFKCVWQQNSVEYLGFKIDEHGLKTFGKEN